MKSLQAAFPAAEIVCVAKIMKTAYKESIAVIAKTLGCTFIDASDHETINGESNPHPRALGMRQIASRVLDPTDLRLEQQHMAADAKAVADTIEDVTDDLTAAIGTAVAAVGLTGTQVSGTKYRLSI